MRKRTLFLVFLVIISFSLCSQNIRLHDFPYSVYEATHSEDENFHLTVKPFLYKDFKKGDSIYYKEFPRKLDHSIFNKNLINKESENFNISLNPIIGSRVIYRYAQKKIFNENSLGLNINSSITKRLKLSADYFILRTNNPFFSSSFQDSAEIVPHFGKSIGTLGDAVLFHSLTGEIAFTASENLHFHLGKGKHFFGNGYRSLFLSGNSNSYPYFKVTADIWRIKYVWLAAKLKDIKLIEDEFDPSLYDKAVFMHYFSLNLTKRININFFESVITNPYDPAGNRSGYEWSYFNPVVFYRPVEFYNGTSDNSIMGLGLNLRIFKSVHLYSQFILDDLIISRINDGSGWWGNKFGLQAGLKSFNTFKVKNLFIRGEINVIRPYTYAHGQSADIKDIPNLNYGNYLQPLAHPLGANFAEGIIQLNYRKGRLISHAQLNIAKKGSDNDTISYGSNVYLSYNLRPDDYGIEFMQGNVVDLIYAKAGVSYIINPSWDLMLDANIQYRKISGIRNVDNVYFSFGISTKIFNVRNDYF